MTSDCNAVIIYLPIVGSWISTKMLLTNWRVIAGKKDSRFTKIIKNTPDSQRSS